MKSLSILVADDEESIRVLLEEWLTDASHMVVAVGNATEGIAAAKKRRFDLVITDVLMPDGDGLALITELKKEQSTVRIVAMSGGGRYLEGDDCLKMARGMGAHAILTKPFGHEQLLAGIKQALAPQSPLGW
jgi:DNA-binding NtrC family response regulator